MTEVSEVSTGCEIGLEDWMRLVCGWGWLNSVSGLVSKLWYRCPLDQSELSISKIPPTDSPTVRPGRYP